MPTLGHEIVNLLVFWVNDPAWEIFLGNFRRVYGLFARWHSAVLPDVIFFWVDGVTVGGGCAFFIYAVGVKADIYLAALIGEYAFTVERHKAGVISHSFWLRRKI